MAESNPSVKLPSGASAAVRPYLSHRARRNIDRLGRTESLKMLAEVNTIGLDLDALITKADRTAKATTGFTPEQDDALVLASVLHYGDAFDGEDDRRPPLSSEAFETLDERDFTTILTFLYELYKLTPDQDEDTEEGKGLSAEPSPSLSNPTVMNNQQAGTNSVIAPSASISMTAP
jgi:hypothetical protein